MSIESFPRNWGHPWLSYILFSLILRLFLNKTPIHSVLLLRNPESSSIAGRNYWVTDGEVFPVFRSRPKRLIPRLLNCLSVRVLATCCSALSAFISRSLSCRSLMSSIHGDFFGFTHVSLFATFPRSRVVAILDAHDELSLSGGLNGRWWRSDGPLLNFIWGCQRSTPYILSHHCHGPLAMQFVFGYRWNVWNPAVRTVMMRRVARCEDDSSSV